MISPRNLIACVVCVTALTGIKLGSNNAQEAINSTEEPKTTFETIGEIEAIKDAEHRLGGVDRIFLIEDDWEFNRCSQLLPKLPKIDTAKESLLVVMSWKHMARKLKAVESEQDTLVVKLDEQKPPPVRADSYHPPKFLIFKLQAWKGPVRIEINGEPRFTIPRGAALTEQSNEIWEEILRLHSGGRPTMPQQIRRYKRMWRDMSDQEIKLHLMENKEKFLREDVAPYYDTHSKLKLRAMTCAI